MNTNLEQRYASLCSLGLRLDLTRGQPGDDNFDLANPLLTAVDEHALVTPSGVAVRNYPGGVLGLREARELFAPLLGVSAEEIMVGNNSSLAMLSNVLMWAMLRGMPASPEPWCRTRPKMIVTVPGYDRHFLMLDRLGISMIPVPMTPDGPDIAQVERIAASDPTVKGILFVPTYSNPTGDTISQHVADRLAAMPTAAPDFTVLADDAYAIHHLADDHPPHPDLLTPAQKAGHKTRVVLFGSTSKITFSSAGIAFLAGSTDLIAWMAELVGTQMISPNKIEQYRHVRFVSQFPGGLTGLMKAHAARLAPKFQAVHEALDAELGGTGLARWSRPKGGYFVNLDTAKPVASRVVELAKKAGVALTPAGATYPFGKDPTNTNLRLSPSRPPVDQVKKAMEIVAVSVALASQQEG